VRETHIIWNSVRMTTIIRVRRLSLRVKILSPGFCRGRYMHMDHRECRWSLAFMLGSKYVVIDSLSKRLVGWDENPAGIDAGMGILWSWRPLSLILVHVFDLPWFVTVLLWGLYSFRKKVPTFFCSHFWLHFILKRGELFRCLSKFSVSSLNSPTVNSSCR